MFYESNFDGFFDVLEAKHIVVVIWLCWIDMMFLPENQWNLILLACDFEPPVSFYVIRIILISSCNVNNRMSKYILLLKRKVFFNKQGKFYDPTPFWACFCLTIKHYLVFLGFLEVV